MTQSIATWFISYTQLIIGAPTAAAAATG